MYYIIVEICYMIHTFCFGITNRKQILTHLLSNKSLVAFKFSPKRTRLIPPNHSQIPYHIRMCALKKEKVEQSKTGWIKEQDWKNRIGIYFFNRKNIFMKNVIFEL